MEPFKSLVSARDAAPDPSKHVNFTLGMVLGVDDFTQEFAYLSGRDRWLARDLIGYGTAWGLKVAIERPEDGPRVLVAPGVAVSPSGQLIRVAPAQCAKLNPWITANREEVLERRFATSSPPGTSVRLYVVLCYRECPTDMVPIPGEPCRDEDELMAPSRIADDFRLELRFDAPEQQEEDATRDFVEWLRQVEVVSDGGSSLEEFLDAVRESSQLFTSPPSSSPPTDFMHGSPPDFAFGSPPEGLSIPAGSVCEYLRAAFLVWVTELRPRWRPEWFDSHPCCEDHAPDKDKNKPEECLLLAELDVPLVHNPVDDVWRVSDTVEVTKNEERRPYLLSLRMLQEWLLCGRAAGGAGIQGPKGDKGDKGDPGEPGAPASPPASGTPPAAIDAPPPPVEVIAAGRFDIAGRVVRTDPTSFSFGGLNVTRSAVTPSLYLLSGTWYSTSTRLRFVVKGTPYATLARGATPGGQFFECIQMTDDEFAREFPGSPQPTARSSGIVVRVMFANNTEPRAPMSSGFVVEVTRYRI